MGVHTSTCTGVFIKYSNICAPVLEPLNQISLSDSYTYLKLGITNVGPATVRRILKRRTQLKHSTAQHYGAFFPNEEILRNGKLSACAEVNIECSLLFDKREEDMGDTKAQLPLPHLCSSATSPSVVCQSPS